MVGPLKPATINNREYDAMFTVIDSFSKYARAIQTSTRATSEEIAFLFVTHVLPFTGVPDELVTDRGSVFIQHLFTELVAAVGIKHKLPSPYHPQSNGALERWHKDLNAHLRAAVLSLKDDATWLDGVGLATLAHNTTYHSVLDCSPYELLFGMSPSSPIDEWKRLNMPHGRTEKC